jgi:hypothetical protein
MQKVKDYRDQSFAKVKAELYDLDTFINRFDGK